MEKIRTEINPENGALETYYWDAANEQVTIKTTWQVGDILRDNKKLANNTLDTKFGKGMMHHVAEIPLGVVHKLLKEHNLDIFDNSPETQRRLRRLLEDPEYQYLKTTVKKLWRPT